MPWFLCFLKIVTDDDNSILLTGFILFLLLCFRKLRRDYFTVRLSVQMYARLSILRVLVFVLKHLYVYPYAYLHFIQQVSLIVNHYSLKVTLSWNNFLNYAHRACAVSLSPCLCAPYLRLLMTNAQVPCRDFLIPN